MSYGLTEYAHSLAEYGSPFWLPHSQGHVLLRPIPGTSHSDAVGCYPLFACSDASALVQDIPALKKSGAVSLTLVTDPLGTFKDHELETAFPQVARPYKTHYLVDLESDAAEFGSAHHRRNARRCGRHASFSICDNPSAHLDTWCDLYEQLSDRHHITGIARFSRQAFAEQLVLPGVRLIAAYNAENQILGMQFWFHDRTKAWHHLSGYSAAGYQHGGVSYGLMAFALTELKTRGVLVANLGAGAGLQADANDGLSAFKQGWSTHTRESWLCGRILNPTVYEQLSGDSNSAYFPAYRDPQLASSHQISETEYAHAD